MWNDTTITREDLREGARRIQWWELALGILPVVAIRFSQHQLLLAGHSDAIRVALFVLPLPAIAAGIWGMLRRHRSNNEFEREVVRAGAVKGLVLTAVCLLVLAQIQLAFGPGPFSIAYTDLWMLPILAAVIGGATEMRRYTRR